jgi:hypothetical protein
VPFRDVVVATDFSLASVQAAEAVIPLLTAGSVIHLVHVWEPSAVHDTRLRALDESYVAGLVTTYRRLLELDRFRRLIIGTSASEDPAEGAILLDAFTTRNRGQRAAVEVDDLSLGAQVLETGYPFQGVTFDSHDQRVELMLGDGKGSMRHLSHGVGNINTVAIATDEHGLDTGLLLKHGSGQTILTFSPD